jgi:hypothetical protein
MAVDTETVSLVVEPLAIIDIAVGVDKSALSVGLIVLPPALVHRSIRPNLLALALADVFALDPLTFVSGVILEFNHRPVLDGV